MNVSQMVVSVTAGIAGQAIDPGNPLRLACHYYVVPDFALCYLVSSGRTLLPVLSGTNLHADRYDV